MDERLATSLEYMVDRYRILDSEFDETNPTDMRTKDYLIEILGDCPKIEVIERVLKHYKDIRDEIIRNDIPMLMAEYGMRSGETMDGTKIGIATFYETKQLDKEATAAWVDKIGYGDIIKDNIALAKGAFDEELERFLNDFGYSYTRDSSINGMQLKAAIKKHLEAGGEYPPTDAIELKIYEQATIKGKRSAF